MLFAARWTSFPIFSPITYFHIVVSTYTVFFSLDSIDSRFSHSPSKHARICVLSNIELSSE
jgi:hypothetical protein